MACVLGLYVPSAMRDLSSAILASFPSMGRPLLISVAAALENVASSKLFVGPLAWLAFFCVSRLTPDGVFECSGERGLMAIFLPLSTNLMRLFFAWQYLN